MYISLLYTGIWGRHSSSKIIKQQGFKQQDYCKQFWESNKYHIYYMMRSMILTEYLWYPASYRILVDLYMWWCKKTDGRDNTHTDGMVHRWYVAVWLLFLR